MIDNILYTSANIAGLGTSSSRSGSSSTSRSSTTSATNGKTLYTLPDGKQYSMTKGEYEEFLAVFAKAASIAGASKMPLPKTTDVLKYGYAVLDSYERGMVFVESNYLAMMGAKQQQHEQQTNTSAAVSNPNDFETLTLPDHTTVQVPQSEANALKQFMVIYDLASEYAYGKHLPQPKWDDVVKYGSVVKDWYAQGKAFDAQSYEQSQLSVQPVGQHYATPIFKECVEYAKANNFPLPSFQWVESFGYKALPKLKELVAERDRTGINIPDPYAPKVVIPDGVMVSVAPSEEKGSSLLVPSIILALGVIGAIALTSKSKKRR
jgi:hypothetical protein